MPWRPVNTLVRLTGKGLQPASERGYWATVKQTTEMLGPEREVGASTKLLVLDIEGVPCGTYSAGEHMQAPMA